jgi:hypothetical protein
LAPGEQSSGINYRWKMSWELLGIRIEAEAQQGVAALNRAGQFFNKGWVRGRWQNPISSKLVISHVIKLTAF